MIRRFNSKLSLIKIAIPKLCLLVALAFTISVVTPTRDSSAGNVQNVLGNSHGHIKRMGLKTSSRNKALRKTGFQRSGKPLAYGIQSHNGKFSRKQPHAKKARTYTITRSVLDMEHGRKIHKVTGKNSHGKKHKIRKIHEARSGVKYVSGYSVNSRKHKPFKGLRQIAGNTSSIKKYRLKGAKTVRRARARNIVNSGNFVFVINNNPSPSMQQVAGNGTGSQGVNDCAFGSYCTIDLGGPKIITFNDVQDIQDGELVDEGLSEEQYLEKYGSK